VDTNAEFSAIGVALGKAGCKKVGTLYQDGVASLADDTKKGVVSQGGQQVATAAIAANAPDVTPAVAKIVGAGAECIALTVSPDDAAKAITALKQSGKNLTMGGISAVFTQQVLTSLGALANGLLIVDTQLNPLGNDPGIAAINADMRSQDPNAKLSQTAVIAWVAAKLIAAALPTVHGTVTPGALNIALDALRNVDLDGVIHPWSSVELSNPVFKRTFNHYAITYKVENTQPAKDGDFFDLGPALIQ
jgi:ABC-type branched-subunit amino acid transport system substrate-binding protein